MSVFAGHDAQVTFSSAQSDVLSVAHVSRWRTSVSSQSTEVTPFKSSFRAFWPNHYMASLEMWGYIDQDASPGFISKPIYANRITVTLRPNRAETNKKLVIDPAWVERFDWQSAIDSANSFYAVVRAFGAATLTWT